MIIVPREVRGGSPGAFRRFERALAYCTVLLWCWYLLGLRQ
jgi:hypothetical protein